MIALLQEKDHAQPQRRFPMFCDSDYGVYREDYFHEMLVFERKRSDRSGKSFTLMMLMISGISGLQSRHETIRGAVDALSAVSRETDITGWYRHASIIGVIFTETDGINTNTLRNRIYKRLRTQLTEEQIGAIRISFHVYPDDASATEPGNPEYFMFYPGYSQSERTNEVAFSMRRIAGRAV